MRVTRMVAALGRGLGALALVSLSGCAYVNLGPLPASVESSFEGEMSGFVALQLQKLRSMPYGQLYVREPSGRELVFILSEQDARRDLSIWQGSGGVSLTLQGPTIRQSSGMQVDVVRSETAQEGGLARYLARRTDELRVVDQGTTFVQTSESDRLLEQTSTIESVQQVYYQGFAYTGPALRVIEQVQTTGQPSSQRRVSWIETRTRSLLRMETPVAPDTDPVTIEWIRVPNRLDPR